MKLLGIWLLLINAAGYVLMGEDKRRALLKTRRIPERVLLLVAAAGGSLGVLLGMLSYHQDAAQKVLSRRAGDTAGPASPGGGADPSDIRRKTAGCPSSKGIPLFMKKF